MSSSSSDQESSQPRCHARRFAAPSRARARLEREEPCVPLAPVSASSEQAPLIPFVMLSDALAALGVYDEPPTREQLAAAEADEGTAALGARLANALYGSALAHVMSAEYAALQLRSTGCRAPRGKRQEPHQKAQRSCCTTAPCGWHLTCAPSSRRCPSILV
jgi:hypothetical protein